MNNEDLYQEDNRQKLVDMSKSLDTLNSYMERLLGKYEPAPTEVSVTGKVEVANQVESLEVTNLDEVSKSLDLLQGVLKKAIEDSAITIPEEITVKNIQGARVESVNIKNLSDIAKYFESLKDAIERIRPIVNVEKQEVSFPRSAKDYVSVRLTDGKSFYDAKGGGAVAMPAGQDNTDPLVGYQPADIDESSSPKYYGFSKKGGYWYILKAESNTFRYAKGAPNHGGGGLYSDAWTDRANLTYGYFHEVF